MSSLLTLRPGAADLGPRYQRLDTDSHLGVDQAMLRNRCYGGGRDLFGGGLPTPPATAAMTAVPVPNGGFPQSQRYSYIPDARQSTSLQKHPNLAASNGNVKLGAAQYNGGAEPGSLPNGLGVPKQEEDLIAAHLQIPESVNSSKGSLSEFAAEITCLFWFETSATLEYAESLPEASMPDRALHSDAIPSIGFKKWVTTILSTTQVGRNVVLLALMFIYRLKKFNPTVSGRKGSEFRLLTIALMLGNKFLDDNTYTNKTWAEVSGISVNEIHIMEVEFLSNMRYELYASQEQWQEWKARLRRFGSFYSKASRMHGSPKAVSPTTPVAQTMSHKLPSPPSGSRVNGTYATLPNPLHALPQLPRSPAKPYPGSAYPFDRKRSLDSHIELPPAKRMQPSFSSTSSLSPAVHTAPSAYTPDSLPTSYEASRLPQLPVPTLPVPALQGGSRLNPLALPGPRAMSTVYPPASGYIQPATTVVTGPPSMSQLPNSSVIPSQPGSARTSPTSLYGLGTPTRPGLSPSYFLENRSSPYRPVRRVDTLLYPPPSAAMQNPIKPIDYQQMQYQPLSKNTNQLRLGPMPSLQPDAWPGQILTPTHQPYRPL